MPDPESREALWKKGRVEIRLLSERDLSAAMRLKELSHWNQTEPEWRRLLKLGPRGCFAACLDQQVIGTVTTAVYGTELAWVGMMLVAPEVRRQGLGKRLMQAALDYLDSLGVTSIKLAATAAGRPLYESLGFVAEGLIERWEGVAPTMEKKDSAITDDQPFKVVYALDSQAFGADRRPWLEALRTEAPFPPLLAARPGQALKGYGLVRRGSRAFYVGPLVARDKETALSLLDGHLGRLAGQRVYLDFNTGFDLPEQVLSDRGLVKQRDLIRMWLGRKSSAGTSNLIFGLSGPEMG